VLRFRYERSQWLDGWPFTVSRFPLFSPLLPLFFPLNQWLLINAHPTVFYWKRPHRAPGVSHTFAETYFSLGGLRSSLSSPPLKRCSVTLTWTSSGFLRTARAHPRLPVPSILFGPFSGPPGSCLYALAMKPRLSVPNSSFLGIVLAIAC